MGNCQIVIISLLPFTIGTPLNSGELKNLASDIQKYTKNPRKIFCHFHTCIKIMDTKARYMRMFFAAF